MQVLEPVQLYGITRDDIQKIVEETIKQSKTRSTIIYLDTSYLYTFHLRDMIHICKFTRLINESVFVENGVWHSPKAMEWHRILERWHEDQTVILFGKPVKPIQISRTMDRVPNEGLINIANSFTGRDFNPMKWHAIGTGADAGDVPSPSATQLVTEQSRIDVTEDPEGGSLSTEGSTIFVVGNHSISTASGDYTETGIFDAEHTDHDNMGDYSIFPDEISHNSNQNAIGSTTVIYQCST
jgi:hypothetical protein